MGLSRALSRALDRVVDAFALVAGAMLLFQVVSVSVDVMLRYFFDAPIPAVISLNEWSLLYIAFLGAAWLQRQGGHVRMEIVSDAFGPRGRAGFSLFGLVLGILCCAVLVWFGIDVTWQKYVNNEYDYFKLREVPIVFVYAVIPVGSFFLLLQLARDAWRHLARFGEIRRGDRETPVTDL